MSETHWFNRQADEAPTPAPKVAAKPERPVDFEALLQRCAKGSQGKWTYDTYNTIWAGSAQAGDLRIVCSIPDHPQDDHYAPEQITERSWWYRESQDNILFIEAARNALKPLIEYAISKEQQCEQLERRVRELEEGKS